VFYPPFLFSVLVFYGLIDAQESKYGRFSYLENPVVSGLDWGVM
jgi:hypothetical protein